MSDNLNLDPSLETCGCCEDLPERDRTNRPGLPAIRYRLGTHGTFKEQLLAKITQPALPRPVATGGSAAPVPTLEALKTRRDDDGAIALLDAWAMVADVLTFYQERIANENYLRTATERRSVLELARSIGYELNPGVSANTYLAFTVEGAVNPSQIARVPAGTQIQSLPEQNQLPQTFETSESITARAAWNDLRPPQTQPHLPTGGDRTLYLDGISTRLEPGDWLLFVGEERETDAQSDRWEIRRVLTVKPNPEANRTRVTWASPLPSNPLPAKPSVYAFRTRASIYGHNAQNWRSLPDVAKATYLGLSGPDELTQADKREWPAYSIFAPLPPVQLSDETSPIVTTSYPTPQFVAAAVKSAISGEIGRSRNRIVTKATEIPKQIEKVLSATVGAVNAVVFLGNELFDIIADLLTETINNITGLFAGNFDLLSQLITVQEALGRTLDDVISNTEDIAAAINELTVGLFNVAEQGTNIGLAVLAEAFEAFSAPVFDADNNLDQPPSFELSAVSEISELLDTDLVEIISEFAGSLQATLLALLPDFDGSDFALSFVQLGTEFENLQALISGGVITDENGTVTAELGLVPAASQALGALTAGQIIELAVGAALQAPLPLPPPTAQSIADVAEDFAEVAVKVVASGPEAVAGSLALSSPTGVVVGASILALDAVVGEDGMTGAKRIQTRLVGEDSTGDGGADTGDVGVGNVVIGADRQGGAIAKALQPITTETMPGTERFPFSPPNTTAVDLDAIYSKITPDSWVMFSYQDNQALYKISSLTEGARSDFGLTGKTTRLTLLGPTLVGSLYETAVRGTLVYGQSEVLSVADRPISDPIAGRNIDIKGLVEQLLPDAPLAVSGKVIRAKIGEFERDLALTALDESETKAIPAGALLWVEAVPVTLSNQTLRWTLRDITGFVGTVTATPAQISYAPALDSDETVSEIAFLKTLPTFNPTTHFQLKDPLRYVYDRTTFSINANVVPSTHGETISTVLGSGDGAKPYQTFPLKKPPLTYVSAKSASGRETTLSVSVNNVRWAEKPAFFGLNSASENYVVRIEDDGTTSVIFGDSQQGARLPTGVENVTTTYRSGIGLVGEVGAGRLTLLKQRPLGIRSVTNPIAATGAEDRENLGSARINAPLTVLTLDRIVSRKDYEDFARAFAGIGKAQAIAIWDGFTEHIHITLAAANGSPLSPSSQTYQNLKQAIETFRDPGPPFTLASFQPRTFDLSGTLLLDNRYDPEQLKSAATQRLLAAFSFSNRQFGEGVSAADIIALVQSVEGVVAVDLDTLHRTDQAAERKTYVGAAIARWNAHQTPPQVNPTELLVINPIGIDLEVKIQ